MKWNTLLNPPAPLQGGATFIFPYLLMLFLVGVPLYFLEMVMGQYVGISSTKVCQGQD
jgi:SNF family Na+-dependent transporter